MRKSIPPSTTTTFTTFLLLFLPFLLPSANATTPGDPKGDYLSTMPLAATLTPNTTTCPADSTACPNTKDITVCCPTNTTCLKKQDVNGVPGYGCCTTALGATCPLLLSNEKCAIEGWAVCGGVEGKLKGATCCEKAEMCREIGRGGWDCAAGTDVDVDVPGNTTETSRQTSQTATAPVTEETTGGAGGGGGGGGADMLGLGVGMAAIAGLLVV